MMQSLSDDALLRLISRGPILAFDISEKTYCVLEFNVDEKRMIKTMPEKIEKHLFEIQNSSLILSDVPHSIQCRGMDVWTVSTSKGPIYLLEEFHPETCEKDFKLEMLNRFRFAWMR